MPFVKLGFCRSGLGSRRNGLGRYLLMRGIRAAFLYKGRTFELPLIRRQSNTVPPL
jgi:hypothetical protein